MTSLNDLVNQAQSQLGIADGNTQWPDATLLDFARKSISQFNMYCPRRETLTLTAAAAGQRVFEVANRVTSVEKVSRDEGKDILMPSEYQLRILGDDTQDNQLVLSKSRAEAVTLGEEYEAEVISDHDYSLAADASLTIPAKYIPTLILGIAWRCTLNRLNTRIASLTIDQQMYLSRAEERARESWLGALECAASEQAKGSKGFITWQLDF